MAIRKAKIEDLTSIVALWSEMMAFHLNRNSIDELKDNAKEIYRGYAEAFINDATKAVYVFEEDRLVLGYVYVEISELPPVYKETQIGVISEIAVSESARRKGIGKLLLDQAEMWLREKGVYRLECAVALGNPVSQSF
jgi:ribosomal protein S18 acetylase RimI-like enzyme